MPPEICPVCDAEVPAGAASCPSCGADENTGWSQSAHCDRLGIPDPDEEFDYGEFLKSEFGDGEASRQKFKLFWLITAIVTLVALLLWFL